MQLLFRVGVPTATLALSCSQDEQVSQLKTRLSQSGRLLGPAECMVLTHGGRVLEDGACLSMYQGLEGGSTIHVTSRLRGGGGDGGSTGAESRSCYLEMYQGKKPDKVNPAEELLARWTRCHISGADLQPPCVIDELGTLYNKEALLQALLTKTLPPALSYITGLKSVTELKLTSNHNKQDKPKLAAKGSHQPGNECSFCCPISGLEFNGRGRFLVHRPTGTVLSEKAVKEVPAVVADMVGSQPAPTDWITVNPSGEQLEQVKQKLAAKMAAEREKKQKKAAAKQAAKAEQALGAAAAAASDLDANTAVQRSVSPEAADLKGVGQKRGSPGLVDELGLDGKPLLKKSKANPKAGASAVYASIFTSSVKDAPKETYMCRSTGARGVHLT